MDCVFFLFVCFVVGLGGGVGGGGGGVVGVVGPLLRISVPCLLNILNPSSKRKWVEY